MTVWTPEKIQAAKIKREATMAAKREAVAKKEARKAAKENGHDNESQQTAAVKSRWASEKAEEQELRQLFAQISIEDGMQLIAKMRGNTEIAARVLNDRITGDQNVERCKTCGGKERGNGWRLRRPYRNQTTQLIVTDVFCSEACISMDNKKTGGTYGISDRGMLKSDNPPPQPTDPTAQ